MPVHGIALDEEQRARANGDATSTGTLAWQARVLVQLVIRGFVLQYRGALLGLLWSLINPLLLMAVYTGLFAHVLKTGVPDYPVFLLAGLIPWTFFASGLNGAATSLVTHQSLLRTHRIPARLFAAAATLISDMNFLLAMALFALYRVWQGVPPAVLVWLGPVFILQSLVTLGLGLSLSGAHAVYRDTHQALLFALRLWFFLTPVLYASHQVPGSVRPLLWANPMAALVAAYRRVLLDGLPPAWPVLGIALAWALCFLAAGALVERKVVVHLAEIV